MKYLLDVNALVAFGHTQHQFHIRVAKWAAGLATNDIPKFATSSITELGFVRVMSQAYNVGVAQSQALLKGLKASKRYDFAFLPDDHDATKLPSWVARAKDTTDGHLSELAKANTYILATLDEKIPNSFLIPQ